MLCRARCVPAPVLGIRVPIVANSADHPELQGGAPCAGNSSQKSNIEDRRAEPAARGFPLPRGIPMSRGARRGGFSGLGLHHPLSDHAVLWHRCTDAVPEGQDHHRCPTQRRPERRRRRTTKRLSSSQQYSAVPRVPSDCHCSSRSSGPDHTADAGAYYFSGQIRSASRPAHAGHRHPYGCPADKEVYVDLSFYQEAARTLRRAQQDFAQTLRRRAPDQPSHAEPGEHRSAGSCRVARQTGERRPGKRRCR